MSRNPYEVGMAVKCILNLEWGLGEILEVNGNMIRIFFNEIGLTTQIDYTIEPLVIFNISCQYIINENVNHFANPDKKKVYSSGDLEKHPPPRRPGVYGWYFDELPPYVTKDGCVPIKTGRWPLRTKWHLLYIGKAEYLRDRIVKHHIKGRHYPKGTMSSLRLSLGCLLSSKLGLNLNYPPETFGKKEEKFNAWLKDHARITWIEVETEKLKAVETAAIKRYTLPLNHDDKQHPLKEPLSKLRSEFRIIAKNDKPKKKYFKKAYKTFVKECKKLGISK